MSNNRSIFEDVSESRPPAQKTATGAIGAKKRGARRAIRVWLMILLTLVAVMTAVGGLTRLTDSGLSITEWKPVMGAIPPLNTADWTAEFDKYQASPQYRIENKGMTLPEFKSIFWWEWGHRQLGRTIGLVWALGFFGFLFMRKIPVGWKGRLLSLGVLGGAQGALGWWMVSSGLTGRMISVASYRLAMHLGLAFIIMGAILWFLLMLKRDGRELLQARRNREVFLAQIATILLVLVFVQILLGALVAGIDAGRSYIDWPLMNGQFLPTESFDLTPFWTNFFENPALVQLNHRMLGYFAFLFALYAWWQSRRSPIRATKVAFNWMMAMVVVQVLLGITTVMNAAAPHIAIVHQFGAILTLGLILRARFMAMYPAAQSLR